MNLPKQKQWNDFITDGLVSVGTWKDPTTGDVCPVCWGSWYKWRVGIFELMDYTDDIKNMILAGTSSFEIESFALKNGMINLERDWTFKIISWVLDLDEVYRFIKNKIE